MSDSVRYHTKDWERIGKLGLHPSVVSPEGYAARVLVGMRLANATLSVMQDTVPSIPTIKGLHYLMFEGVHPWAGTFRQAGHEVRAGRLVCSPAQEVVGDLMKLRKEMMDNSLSGSREYRAEVLAFYHASFLAIHPFADGNGRVSRVILDNQTKKLLGHPLSNRIGREEYIEALSVAQDDGQLRPLAKLISRNDLKLSKPLDVHLTQRRLVEPDDGLLVSKPRIIEEEKIRGRVRR